MVRASIEAQQLAQALDTQIATEEERVNDRARRMSVQMVNDHLEEMRLSQAGGPGYIDLTEVVGRAETVMFTLNRCRREDGLYCPTGRVWRGLHY